MRNVGALFARILNAVVPSVEAKSDQNTRNNNKKLSEKPAQFAHKLFDDCVNVMLILKPNGVACGSPSTQNIKLKNKRSPV
jgi:hypothetical protein